MPIPEKQDTIHPPLLVPTRDGKPCCKSDAGYFCPFLMGRGEPHSCDTTIYRIKKTGETIDDEAYTIVDFQPHERCLEDRMAEKGK